MDTHSPQPADLGRRDMLRAVTTAGTVLATTMLPIVATTAVAAVPADRGSPEPSFMAAFDAPIDKPDAAVQARLAFLHDDAIVIDHDAPFPMTKAGYADHLGFHMANLQRAEVRFHELKTIMHGNNSAVISAYFIERSKPKDAGFRLRAGYCTAVCTRTATGWKALSLHMSPLTAQVTDASPG
jgi:ketosteroid isomerase-like protein